MYKIGLVENNFTMLPTYQERLELYDITLLWPPSGSTKEEIVKWILENNIRCLLVDYKLVPEFEFIGTDLIAYIKRKLPDLSCFILTSFQGDSINENLVEENMILERAEFERSDLSGFISMLKQAVDVCSNRLQLRKDEYIKLLEKRKAGNLDTEGIEQLLDFYRILRAFDEVDDIPSELLRPEIGQKMDAMLKSLDALIEKTSQPKGE